MGERAVITIAQVGAGRMGELHARNAAANPRLDLRWIADNDPARALALAVSCGARAAPFEQILADPAIRGVIVATSTDALLGTALACLRVGKAVFTEKPLSLSVGALEAATMLAAAPAPLFVAFNRRFDPHFAELKRRLDIGDVGELETLHLINHDPAAPSLGFIPRSGGLFKDFTIHDFDTAAWLLGERIVELIAWSSCLVDPAIGELGDVDTAKLILKTGSGKLCLISNSRRTGYGYDQRIEAFGSKGALRVENVQPTALTRWGEPGQQGDAFHYAFPDRYADAYRLELDHFADMIENGEAPRTGYRDALAALRLAEAADESARSGRPVALVGGTANV